MVAFAQGERSAVFNFVSLVFGAARLVGFRRFGLLLLGFEAAGFCTAGVGLAFLTGVLFAASLTGAASLSTLFFLGFFGFLGFLINWLFANGFLGSKPWIISRGISS